MTLQKIEFEYDIPDGYRFVRYGEPIYGEQFLSVDGSVIITFDFGMMATKRIIVKKIPEQEQQAQNPKRHKHADLIHAWAEGAEVQLKFQNHWEDCDPLWEEDDEYRIKPKTKTVRFRNYLSKANVVGCCYEDLSDRSYFKKWLGDWQEAEIEK